MPTMTLTDKRLRGLRPPASGRVEVRDALVRGLEFRLTAQGAATWRLLYRHEGRLVRLTLGKYPALALAEARTQARRRLAEVATGHDPAAERRARRAAETVEALVERFLDTDLRPRVEAGKRSPAYLYETTRLLTREVVPAWGTRKARDITRRDVKALLDAIAARPAPITANRTLAALSRFFTWCLDGDVLDTSPALRVPAPGEETERQRVLTAAEIRALWSAGDALTAAGARLVSPQAAAWVRLRILTAQRGGETATLRWADLDEAGAWWTIPAERTKNRLAHRVPLSPQARQVLGALPRADAYVFPGRRAGRPTRALRRAWGALVTQAALTDVVPHDLRRTAASGMASLGVPRLVIGKVLNHVEPGVTRVYDRHSYDAEKRDALERWGRQVDALLAGATGQAEVIPLRPSRPEAAEGAR